MAQCLATHGNVRPCSHNLSGSFEQLPQDVSVGVTFFGGSSGSKSKVEKMTQINSNGQSISWLNTILERSYSYSYIHL